jgi:hypothetical protein
VVKIPLLYNKIQFTASIYSCINKKYPKQSTCKNNANSVNNYNCQSEDDTVTITVFTNIISELPSSFFKLRIQYTAKCYTKSEFLDSKPHIEGKNKKEY